MKEFTPKVEQDTFDRHIYKVLNSGDNYHYRRGITSLVKEYSRMWMLGNDHLPEFVEGLGNVIENTKVFNQTVIPDAIEIADRLKLWELSSSVEKIRESKLYSTGFLPITSQNRSHAVKEKVDMFFIHKRMHDLKEDPTLLIPDVYSDIINSLDLKDFESNVQESI